MTKLERIGGCLTLAFILCCILMPFLVLFYSESNPVSNSRFEVVYKQEIANKTVLILLDKETDIQYISLNGNGMTVLKPPVIMDDVPETESILLKSNGETVITTK